MNLLQLPPQQRVKLFRFLPLARNMAWVSGCFTVLVCIILGWSVWQFHRTDPIQSSQLQSMIEQIQQGNETPEFIDSVRNYDLMIRRAHFTALAFIRFGGYLLLGGLALFLLALKFLYELGRKPPLVDPVPLEDSGKIYFWQTAILVVALGLSLTAFLLPRLLSRSQPSNSITTPPPALEENQQNWPGFRGYQSLGLAYDQTPPLDWDLAKGKNILWKTELQKPGFNSPVIWSDRVFISGADDQSRAIFCYDLQTGDLLWQTPTTVTKAFDMPNVTEDTGLAAPTLAVDGRAVAAIFATGELLVLDPKGNRLWEKKLPPVKNAYGHASSLIIHQNNLLVQYDITEKGGQLYAFDLLTGKQQWMKKRDVETTWSSPILISTPKGDQLILTATPFVAAYDPQTGDSLWQLEDVIDGEIGPSPAFDEGRLFFINQYSTLACVDATTHTILWNIDRDLSDIPSLAAQKNLLIVPTSFGKVSCLSALDGKLLWEHRFDHGFYASPIIVGEHVFLLDLEGTMHILKLTPTFQLVGSPKLDEACVSTPAFAGSRIVIRTRKQLIAVGVPTP